MSWVMTTEREGADISAYIGAIKVANIHLIRTGVKGSWKAHLRFHDGEPEGKTYDSVSIALSALHHLLSSPPGTSAP